MTSPATVPAPEAPTVTDELLPIGEAARRLGVSVETVRRWDRDGLIRATRTLGNQRRFLTSEIDRVRENRAT